MSGTATICHNAKATIVKDWLTRMRLMYYEDTGRFFAWSAVVVIGVVAVVVVGSTLASFESGGSSPSQSASERTPEEGLATLETGGSSETDVRPYRIALNGAEGVCTEGRSEIADMAFRGSELAAEQGADATALEFIQALPQVVERESRPTQCSDIIGALVVMMRP